MTRESRKTNGTAWLAAGVAAGLAVLCYFVPGKTHTLKVTPVELEAWRAHLLEREDERARPGAGLEEFAQTVTGGRIQTIGGPVWTEFSETVHGVAGRWREDVRADWRAGISEEDESHVVSVFFSPQEPPFATLEKLPPPGETVYLRTEHNPNRLLEVVHVPPGVREGEVTTSRFYKSRWTLPVAFAFPLRTYAGWLLALAALALVAGPALRLLAARPTGPASFANPRRTSGRYAFVVLVGAALLCFAPAGLELDGMDGGYALIVLSGLVALTALITFVMLGRSAGRLDRLFSGEGLLARWTYAPDEWRRFVALEYDLSSGEKRSLFRLVFVISLVVGVGFVVLMRDEASLIVFGVLMGLMGVLRVLVEILPRTRHRRLLERPGEVFIGRAGVFFSGEFHDFALGDGRLEAAEVLEEQGMLLVAFTYSFRARHGRQTVVARVPVPMGLEGEAREVAQRAEEAWRGSRKMAG